MNKIHPQIRMLLTSLTAIVACQVSAQTNEGVTAAAEKLPLVTIQVQRNDKDVTASFTIKVTIANTTGAPIILRRLVPTIPVTLQRNLQEISLEGRTLQPGQKIIKRIPVPEASTFHTLLFVSSTWEIGAVLFYDLEDINQQTREIEQTETVDWKGSIWGKLFGGLIGCAALALFLSSRQPPTPTAIATKKATGFYRFLCSFSSTFAVGAATVLAATLLLAFLSTGSLPVTFSVDDWRGGALLGLFSVPIGGWLLDKLTEKKLGEKDDRGSTDLNADKTPDSKIAQPAHV
jgi:hypothetical protein